MFLWPPLFICTSCLRLKTVEMVIRNTQGAEGVLKQYEDCLREVHTVPSDTKEVEAYRTKLKVKKQLLQKSTSFQSFCLKYLHHIAGLN